MSEQKIPEQIYLPGCEPLLKEKIPMQLVLPGYENYVNKRKSLNLPDFTESTNIELKQIIVNQFKQIQFLFKSFLNAEKGQSELKAFNQELLDLTNYLSSAKSILESLLKPDAIIALDSAFSKIGLKLMEYLQADAFTCRKILPSGNLRLVSQYQTQKAHPIEISKDQIIPQSNLDKILEQHQSNPIESMCTLEEKEKSEGLSPIYQIDLEINGGSVILPICDAYGDLERIFTFYFSDKTELELQEIKENCFSFYPSFLDTITKTRILQELVCIDSLTQVYNRKMFLTFLTKELKSYQRWIRDIQSASEFDSSETITELKKQTISLLLLDIDHFKRINDTYGHIIGDYVLSALGTFLNRTLRESDIIGRYGGEEFVILLPSTDLKGAFEIGEKLREKISTQLPEFICKKIETAIAKLEKNASHHLKTAEKQVLLKALRGCADSPLTVSIGVATSQVNDEVEHILSRADEALYKAKELGRNRVM